MSKRRLPPRLLVFYFLSLVHQSFIIILIHTSANLYQYIYIYIHIYQTYNSTETSPLICWANQYNGLYINVSLDWHGLAYDKICYAILGYWYFHLKVGCFIQSFHKRYPNPCLGIATTPCEFISPPPPNPLTSPPLAYSKPPVY